MLPGQLDEVGPAVADGVELRLVLGDILLLEKSKSSVAAGRAHFGLYGRNSAVDCACEIH